MKQSQFEAQHAPLWNAITRQLSKTTTDRQMQFPALYRSLCQSLALARQRGYSPSLTDYLHSLVLSSHRLLYGTPAERPLTLRRWMFVELPCRVRAEWRLLSVAMLAFWGVGLAVGLLIWFQPQWAYSFMDVHELEKYRQMYQPGKTRLGRSGSEEDVMMFGFYIWNNVSIGFRTFAGGLLGGVPALLSLLSNGVHGGLIASYLSKDPGTRQAFWSFVVTHSSFEITGLILSGVSGMRLGLALIHPGRFSRRHALMLASQRTFPILIGAALLTVLAAFFEAFWSASGSIAPEIKYAVGGLCWFSVIAFFALAGWGHDAAR